MKAMPRIIFLPGLGADERLFHFINLPGFEIKYVKWVTPFPKESLNDYCRRLMDQMEPGEPPVFIGVSMGGIAAMELREMMEVKKTILISSVKCRFELPFYLSVVKKTGINKTFSPAMLKKGAKILKPFVAGTRNKITLQLFDEMVKDADDTFITWGINETVHWKKENYNRENLVHIHGNKDLVFPLRHIRNYHYMIKNGMHDMVMSSPAEINSILQKEISC